MGRHKIAIKKILETQPRQVCFSKRRKGLFKKAADICAASRVCSIAIIIFSAAGNLYTFAHPSVESVSLRFLGEASIHNLEPEKTISEDADCYQEESDDCYDVGDAESDRGDKEEAIISETNAESDCGDKEEVMISETRKETLQILEDDQFWWNKPIDGLRLEELLDLKKSMIKLRGKVHDRAGFLLAEKPLSLCSWLHK